MFCANLVSPPLPEIVSAEIIPVKAMIIFLTVPDDKIVDVAKQLQPFLTSQHLLIHTSGVLSTIDLTENNSSDAQLLSLHPIRSFSTKQTIENPFHNIFITIEGHSNTHTIAKKLIQDLMAIPLIINPEQKALYHTALCIASNYLVTLADCALKLCQTCGLSEAASRQMVQSLMNGTLQNIAQVGPDAALTGPIERGDYQTIAKHLSALNKQSPDVLNLYQTLGKYTLNLIKNKNHLSPSQDTISKLFEHLE